MNDEPANMSKDELWEALADATGFRRGDILLYLSRELSHEDQYVQAISCAEEAVTVFEQAGYPRERAYALRQVAHIMQHQGNFTAAIEGYKAVLPLLEEFGNDMDLAWAYEAMADCVRHLANYEQAAEWYDLAEDFYLNSSDGAEPAIWAAQRFALCLNFIGGRDDEMLETMIRVVDMAKGTLKIHQVNDLREQLIYAYTRMEQYDEALTEAKARLAVARTCACSSCVPNALIDLGYVQDLLDLNDLAMASHQEAYSMALEKNLALLQAHAMTFFGYKAIKTDPAKARDYFEQNEAIFDSLDDNFGMTNMKRMHANVAKAEGKLDQALAFLKEELAARTHAGDMRNAAQCQQHLAKVYLEKGCPRNAIQELSANGWVNWSGLITSKDVAKHKALHAKALLADGQVDAALGYTIQLLSDLDPERWFDILGMAHEVRAYALRHRDPIASERAAGRALACYTEAQETDSAKKIAQEFFIQPYLTLAKIDVDNQLRAEAQEAERQAQVNHENVYLLQKVAETALQDPIEREVEDAQVLAIRPDENDEGIA